MKAFPDGLVGPLELPGVESDHRFQVRRPVDLVGVDTPLQDAGSGGLERWLQAGLRLL